MPMMQRNTLKNKSTFEEDNLDCLMVYKWCVLRFWKVGGLLMQRNTAPECKLRDMQCGQQKCNFSGYRQR